MTTSVVRRAKAILYGTAPQPPGMRVTASWVPVELLRSLVAAAEEADELRRLLRKGAERHHSSCICTCCELADLRRKRGGKK